MATQTCAPLNALDGGLVALLDEIELITSQDPSRAREQSLFVQQTLAQRAGAALDEALTGEAEVLRLRALLVQADVQGRLGQPTASGRTLRSVNRWATENKNIYLLAWSHRLLAIFFAAIGDDASFLEHAVRSVELLDDGERPLLRADHLSILALAEGRTGSLVSSRETSARAGELAVQGNDPAMFVRILNNAAYLEHLAGEHELAVVGVQRMLDVRNRYGVPPQALHADTVAQAYLEVGRFADAEAALKEFLSMGPAVLDPASIADPDGAGELLLTLAEVRRRRGDLSAAAVTLEQCWAICEARGLAGVQVRARLERAHLREAEGDYREAYLELKSYLADSQALNTTASEVRIRTLQTMYETEEARRSSERYQQMALCDPLTGLYNRRYIDSRLPALLGPDANAHDVLSAAFVDLDHFKRVNDTFSHDVGDQVLRVIGQLLSDAAPEPAWAARVGDEEFLLVLPGTDPAAARKVCEELQTRIRGYDWAPLVEQMPIRASIGLTTQNTATTTQAALLADADRRVYAAKARGRDQIVDIN